MAGKRRKVRRCSAGRKRRYGSKLSAKLAIADTQRSRSSTREESRFYYCHECLGYHLTSRRR